MCWKLVKATGNISRIVVKIMVFWDAVPHIVADVYNQIQSNGDIGYTPGHFTSRYYNKCHN